MVVPLFSPNHLKKTHRGGGGEGREEKVEKQREAEGKKGGSPVMPVKSIFFPPSSSLHLLFSHLPLSPCLSVSLTLPTTHPLLSLYLSISLLLSGGSFDVNICQLLFMCTHCALQDGIKQSESERCVRYKNDWGGNVGQMHSFGRKNDSASELESQAITPLAVNTSSPLCSPHVFFKKLKTNKEICLPAP